MTVDKDMVKKVAALARIELSDKEAEGFRKDLEEILSAFRTLQRIPTKGVKPTFHPVEVRGVLREDKVEPSILRDRLLKNLKNKEDGYIKGPRVV
ncbi:MAG: Asp-tRNA(Asn)/Glu-tRNA(Gln) amidotransferase subunit GatC [Candidatus Aenigmarchaeota archaeon]|nr:Asp-tRNA(Asn)/Glu-tRNA(Gln) amidotransferase subunit GatC [Candidatus Aenigmarchaeota archaeon]